ncbi:hypothetical protein [Mastigocoleus testarum]|uniref:Uncharacterized protein n=1 Tax=Mastigocoleus testarum BC008 TaxID=371196 RepID=A0A0V7ZQ97_9CYAN|nr:hypothetical protein [Mastigocoleus testarum]KST66765.1 hypothetical protein BC008_26630 [Mastigocoleus testarum BC008]
MLNRKNYLRQFTVPTSVCAVALSALLIGACNNTNPEANAPNETTASEQTNTTASEVVNKTDELIGKTVTIRSEPVKKISPATFTVSDNQFFSGETILVVNASGETATLPEDTELQITGEVGKFVAADIERKYNLKLDPQLYVDYESKPAIIAQSIAQAPKPGEITNNPSQYYNKILAVPGEIEDVKSDNTFTLDEDRLIGGSDLLVLVADSKKATVKDGETVVATGVLRPFIVAELEKEYEFTWDAGLKQKLEAEFRDKPVLVATSVYPSALPEEKK